MKIAIVTDNTVNLPNDIKKNKNIFIINIPLIVNNRIYFNISIKEYYKKFLKFNNIKTTQPSLGNIIKLYKNILKLGYDYIISIHLSSKLSGLFNNLKILSNTDNWINKLYVYDSKITSFPMGYMIKIILNLIKKNKKIYEIFNKLDFIREKMYIYFVIDNLFTLIKGGRFKKSLAIIGNLFSIKPILYFDNEGKIKFYKKSISILKAFYNIKIKILNLIKNNKTRKIKLCIMHANNLKLALIEKEKILKLCYYNIKYIDICEIHSSLIAHLGEKSIGIALTIL